VSIVGMRRASGYGLDVARAVGRDLALAGVPVVSGMALGVDSAAHAGRARRRRLTVAVLAGGADVPYPAQQGPAVREIADRGLVVSELPPGFRAHRWCFPARNRIIAALGDLTVVVEAAERSGSLITAELATKLGRRGRRGAGTDHCAGRRRDERPPARRRDPGARRARRPRRALRRRQAPPRRDPDDHARAAPRRLLDAVARRAATRSPHSRATRPTGRRRARRPDRARAARTRPTRAGGRYAVLP
jgi:hypothetical protein